jgi:hypothetical protein
MLILAGEGVFILVLSVRYPTLVENANQMSYHSKVRQVAKRELVLILQRFDSGRE